MKAQIIVMWLETRSGNLMALFRARSGTKESYLLVLPTQAIFWHAHGGQRI
jgi:hypothetical protein